MQFVQYKYAWPPIAIDQSESRIPSIFRYVRSEDAPQAPPLLSGRLLWCLGQHLQGFCGPPEPLHLAAVHRTLERTVNWRSWGLFLHEDCGRLGKMGDYKVGCPLILKETWKWQVGDLCIIYIVFNMRKQDCRAVPGCWRLLWPAPASCLLLFPVLWPFCTSWPSRRSEELVRVSEPSRVWVRPNQFACPCHQQNWIWATWPLVGPPGWFWPGVLETSA